MPQLSESVHHRVYLVAYDLDKDELFHRIRTAILTRAAVLTELALRGDIVDKDGRVRVADDRSTGDAALDEAKQQIGERDHGWKTWLQLHFRKTLDSTEAQLRGDGLLTASEKKVLGLVSKEQLKVTDPALVVEAQEEASEILRGAQSIESIGPRAAAVAALAATGGAPAVGSRKSGREHDSRVEELTEGLAMTAPGLDKAFRRIRLTTVTFQGGFGGS